MRDEPLLVPVLPAQHAGLAPLRDEICSKPVRVYVAQVWDDAGLGPPFAPAGDLAVK